jgi:hypothetical protein
MAELSGDGTDPVRLPDSLSALAETPFAPHARSLTYVAALADDDLQGEILQVAAAKHQAGVGDS